MWLQCLTATIILLKNNQYCIIKYQYLLYLQAELQILGKIDVITRHNIIYMSQTAIQIQNSWQKRKISHVFYPQLINPERFLALFSTNCFLINFHNLHSYSAPNKWAIVFIWRKFSQVSLILAVLRCVWLGYRDGRWRWRVDWCRWTSFAHEVLRYHVDTDVKQQVAQSGVVGPR